LLQAGTGLDGWNSVYDVAAIVNDTNSQIRIWQIRRVSKGCISYMIATESDKKDIVIDPTCEIDNVISKIVNENGLKITKVIDTHMHADHLSGATRLAKRYGAYVYVSSLEDYDYGNSGDGINFKSVMDGDTTLMLEKVLACKQFILLVTQTEVCLLNFNLMRLTSQQQILIIINCIFHRRHIIH
jgi:Metallo-beta-lactamase superfamily